MATYVCEICGYVYDEENEQTKWSALADDWCCPLCTAPKTCFKQQEEAKSEVIENVSDLQVDIQYARHDDPLETQMQLIHEMAIGAHSRIEAMRTRLAVPDFKDILLLGGQLAHPPLPDKAEVSTTTIIGASAQKPMVLEHPVYVSHMSFGALSKEAKIALAMGSAMAKTAQCSGEGGILKEEQQASYRFIFEYVPNKYSVTDENLKNADAIEIKIGQGSKPGMGGHLPGEKVTKEIAAGRIEEDLEWIHYANPDFITIDGRGGATGASPKYLKDNTTVPTMYALARARAYMDAHDMKQQLVMTGGFRNSGDMIKALAMGADAIAIASAAMMAIGCQQYRICQNGKCPMGIATQDEELRKRFNIEKGAQCLGNYLHVLCEELKSFARVCGYDDVHKLSKEDLCTTSEEIARYTGIKHC